MKDNYTVGELSKSWQISERTVRRLIEAKKLEALKIGKIYRVPSEEKTSFEHKNKTTVD